jgi:hypothetical protein
MSGKSRVVLPPEGRVSKTAPLITRFTGRGQLLMMSKWRFAETMVRKKRAEERSRNEEGILGGESARGRRCVESKVEFQLGFKGDTWGDCTS